MAKRLEIFVVLLLIGSIALAFFYNTKSPSAFNPHFERRVISLDLPEEDEGIGGVIAADLNNDHKMDFVITKPGYLGAWENSGKKIWSVKADIQITKQSEYNGLPGWHAPGVQVGDIDADNVAEVLFLTTNSYLCILDGRNGVIKHSIELRSPEGTERWEHLVLSNFRGAGDHDLLLQATEDDSYRMGRYIAAFSWESLMGELPVPLWERDDFIACAHSGARVADLNGDGKDEVLGGSVISPEGKKMFQIPLEGHIDAITVKDIRPDIPGLEVLALEEGGGWNPFKGTTKLTYYLNRIYDRILGTGNRIFLYNQEQLIWMADYRNKEPQNSAVGDFIPMNDGLEIWCRSRYSTHQKPFTFDGEGNLLSRYKMNGVAPDGWTNRGVEEISAIHWDGSGKQLCAAKERHKAGNIAIFDPIKGTFHVLIGAKADRIYVADVQGDWREELIALCGNQLHIYVNLEPNPNSSHESLWSQNWYRRNKMTWNYYAP